jgi:hypothetical protein
MILMLCQQLEVTLNKNNLIMKVSALLALREQLSGRFNRLVSDYTAFFKNKQGAFTGIFKTYVPVEGFPVDPSKVANERIVTTVNEKMDWFITQALEYINNTLAIELTNGEGAATTYLVFEGEEYGPFPATVLLRLKSIIENDKFHTMLQMIPVREDSKVWLPVTDDDDYINRGNIVQTERFSGETRTTITHVEILKDPNLDPAHLPANYRAETANIPEVIKTGDYTYQQFSGQWTHQQRAALLKRRSDLLDAITVALQKVNDRDQVPCDFRDLLTQLIYGKQYLQDKKH